MKQTDRSNLIMENPPTTPERVVQRQLDAYNARDLEGLLAVYADEAEHFEHPSTLLARGSTQLRARFALRFSEPNLHARLLQRIVMGQMVMDHELVTRTFPEGPGQIELVAIYEVEGQKIARAWFMPGPKTLHSGS
jgi:hypothetical protein